jgi:DNA-binding NarL/FixJ family response regulator
MVMSDMDVVRYYKNLKDKKSAPRLIADLNDTSVDTIYAILEAHGVAKAPPKKDRRPRKDWQEVERLYRKGLSDAEIARRTDRSVGSVWSWRERCDLPRNPQKKGEGLA